MDQSIKNGCEFAGTKYCTLLNMRNCAECTAKNGDLRQMANDLDLYETLLPQGGISHLFTEVECQFCKGEPARRNGYAILDMAHPEPKRLQQRLFGKHMAPFGTMIPVQMGICKSCRRKLLMLEYLPIVMPLIVGVIGLIVFSIESVTDPLLATASYLPFLIWAAATAAAIVVSRLIVKQLEKKYDETTYVDVLKHPSMREMMQLGWFPIVRQSRTKVTFSKSRLAKGLGTACEAEEQ